MPRDYAKNRKKNYRRSAAPGWLWVVAVLLLALLLAGLYGLYLHKPPLPRHAKSEKSVAKKGRKEQKEQKGNGPVFDFYTILPNSNSHYNATPPATAPPSQAKPAKPAAPAAKKALPSSAELAPVTTAKAEAFKPAPAPRYLLQVAAVRSYSDADQLKAELTLLGFNVFIQKTQGRDGLWNRVNIGPYASAQAAKADQKRLGEHKIHSILRDYAAQ